MSLRSALLVVLVPLGACGGSSPASMPDLASASDLAGADLAMTQGTSACVPAGYVAVPFATATPERSFGSAQQVLEVGADYVAAIDTDQGCVVIDLFEADTPITSNSFAFLALHHYFDGLAFHRVIEGFMAQTGCPNTASGSRSSWGQGDPGYAFGLEVTPSRNYDAAGTVGMARTSNPNSNGSQFFITFGPAHSLDQQYTIFGGVTAGLDVLPSIARGEPPATPTRITRVTIAKK